MIEHIYLEEYVEDIMTSMIQEYESYIGDIYSQAIMDCSPVNTDLMIGAGGSAGNESQSSFNYFKKQTIEPETDEEKVIRLMKGGFEKHHGITFERFIEIYHCILEKSPEKLI